MSLPPPLPQDEAPGAVDPALAARMERLAQRSAAAKEAAASRTADTATAPSPRRPGKRTHAARSARWLSLAMSLLATVILTVSFSILSLPAANQVALAAAATQTTTAASTVSTTFDGQVVSTRWGPVQVQAQFKNGVLEDVVPLLYPNDRSTSIRINEVALPMLRTEALTVQSANVDTISGASVTSRGYAASLQSAIDAAQAAGAISL